MTTSLQAPTRLALGGASVGGPQNSVPMGLLVELYCQSTTSSECIFYDNLTAKVPVNNVRGQENILKIYFDSSFHLNL